MKILKLDPAFVIVRIPSGTERVYAVPEGRYVQKGDTVLVDYCGNECMGECVTDMLYAGPETAEFISRACGMEVFPRLKARYVVERFA